MWFFRAHWGSLEVIGELLGVHLEFDGSPFGFYLGLLGNSLGLFEASWQFIFGSFRVHWGSLEVIGEMFGIHLEFNGTMGVHLDCDRDNWRLL